MKTNRNSTCQKIKAATFLPLYGKKGDNPVLIYKGFLFSEGLPILFSSFCLFNSLNNTPFSSLSSSFCLCVCLYDDNSMLDNTEMAIYTLFFLILRNCVLSGQNTCCVIGIDRCTISQFRRLERGMTSSHGVEEGVNCVKSGGATSNPQFDVTKCV